MHLHLPKPLHGWREFLGEVGIIVIGVMIALAAEQVIEGFRWQEKVNRTKNELNSELHDDALAAYYWLSFHRCMEAQLNAADAAVRKARESGVIAPITAYDPPLVLFTSDAWFNARSLEVADRMGPQAMRDYSRLFFFPTEIQGNIVQLQQLAAELEPLTKGIDRVSSSEAGAYQRTIGKIRELQHRTEFAEILLIVHGKEAGIRLSDQEIKDSLQFAKSASGSCAAAPMLTKLPAKPRLIGPTI